MARAHRRRLDQRTTWTCVSLVGMGLLAKWMLEGAAEFAVIAAALAAAVVVYVRGYRRARR